MTPNSKASFKVRMDLDLKTDLETRAALDGRSLNEFLISIATAWLDDRVYIPRKRLSAAPAEPQADSDPEAVPGFAYKRRKGRQPIPKPHLLEPKSLSPEMARYLQGKDFIEGDAIDLRETLYPHTRGEYAMSIEATLIDLKWWPCARVSDGIKGWCRKELLPPA